MYRKDISVNIAYTVSLRSSWVNVFKYVGYVLYYELYNVVIVLDAAFHLLQVFSVL